MKTYNEIWDGEIEHLANIPVESFMPLLLLRHISTLATKTEMTSKAFTYGFDPEMIYEKYRPKTAKKEDLLKPIQSYFSDPEEGDDDHLFSIILDENAFNSFILDFVLVDRNFSLRELIEVDPKTRDMTQQMVTDSIGLLMPQVLEEYGPGKNVDVMFTLSHSLISEKLDSQRVSGFQMDKNGNFRLTLNVAFQLLVDKFGTKGVYEEARSFYMSLVGKGKFVVKEVSQDMKMLTIVPKSAEVSALKIFKSDGEE